MLSEKMVHRLNEQINLEFYSSNLYLQMSSWCSHQGFEGSSAFLKRHAEEEQGHMQRLFQYVEQTGALAVLGTIKSPPAEFKSLEEVFQQTYEHEVHVTKKINELADTALEEKDYSTFNFLQWYVAEQHEEESLFKSILDKVAIIGTEGSGLFFLDREIGGMAAAAPKEE
jgi:ferritin